MFFYSSLLMVLNKTKFFCGASCRQRIVCGGVFVVLSALFIVLWLMAKGTINADALFDPCGFKVDYGLPCPTCWVTTSAMAFASGRIFESFYIQPAGALFCFLLAITGFLAFITAVFGLYFTFLKRLFAEIKIWHVILMLLIILLCGWAVTLSRAFNGR